MGFKEARCPHCSKVIQVPTDAEQILCMYCGKGVAVARVLESTDVEGKSETPDHTEAFEKYASYAREHFPELLSEMDNPMRNFRKKLYPEAFKEYCSQNKELTDSIEQAYVLAEEPEVFIKELAQAFVGRASEDVFSNPKKRMQKERVMNLNLEIVGYISPMLMDTRKQSGELLIDEVLVQWKQMFPDENVNKSTFESINGGFKKKLCYITTAVCEILGRPDDCYELNLLRGYRDGYLTDQPGGAELVKEYYDIAPTIVKRINRQTDSKEVYEQVWEDYLKPCVRLIEEGQNEECREVYVDMVHSLKKKYITH